MERLENLIKYDILKQKENLFIIDAKYYLINKMIYLVYGWSSIVKQMYYRLSLSKEFDSIKIFFIT